MDELLYRGLHRLVRCLDMQNHEYAPGLEGVIAGETAVSSWQDGPQYRGYRLEELVRGSTFLEVAYLLVHGELPCSEFFADFESIIYEAAELDPAIGPVLESLPLHLSPLQTLRTAISLAGNLDPQAEEHGPLTLEHKAARLIAQLPSLIALRHRVRCGLPPIAPHPAQSYASNLLHMLTGQDPSPEQEQALETLLIVNAEQGFSTAAFAARVVTSAGTDLHGAVVAALGTMEGDWNETPTPAIADTLDRLDQLQTARQVENWLIPQLQKGELIDGFRIGPTDRSLSRNRLLAQACQKLADHCGQSDFEQKAQLIEKRLQSVWKAAPHCGWYTQRLTRYLGLDAELAIVLYTVSQIPGWIAHCVEQVQFSCRFRPAAHYVGHPERRYVPLAERS